MQELENDPKHKVRDAAMETPKCGPNIMFMLKIKVCVEDPIEKVMNMKCAPLQYNFFLFFFSRLK